MVDLSSQWRFNNKMPLYLRVLLLKSPGSQHRTIIPGNTKDLRQPDGHEPDLQVPVPGVKKWRESWLLGHQSVDREDVGDHVLLITYTKLLAS